MIASLSRPDSWNVPLLVHIFGAMLLVGGLLVGAASLFVARGEVRVIRLGYKTLLAISLPGYILMRVGAEWIYSKEHLDELLTDSAWIGIGYITADAGALLLLISLILGAFGLRKARSGGAGLLRASLVISVILLAAYVVTIWAMGAKPN